jgi:hypothetical protein
MNASASHQQVVDWTEQIGRTNQTTAETLNQATEHYIKRRCMSKKPSSRRAYLPNCPLVLRAFEPLLPAGSPVVGHAQHRELRLGTRVLHGHHRLEEVRPQAPVGPAHRDHRSSAAPQRHHPHLSTSVPHGDFLLLVGHLRLVKDWKKASRLKNSTGKSLSQALHFMNYQAGHDKKAKRHSMIKFCSTIEPAMDMLKSQLSRYVEI